MNDYIDAQIKNMVIITKTFKQSCKMAAMKNDDKIDKAEKRLLKKIDTTTNKFIKELQKIT